MQNIFQSSKLECMKRLILLSQGNLKQELFLKPLSCSYGSCKTCIFQNTTKNCSKLKGNIGVALGLPHLKVNGSVSSTTYFKKFYSTMAGDKEAREFKITVPFGHIAGKVWNESAPTAVLCLHGWQDNAGTFDHLVPLLPDHLCLVAVDFPGHGSSSHKQLGFSSIMMDYLITIDRVVKHYGWDKIVLMGHSMGGAVSMLYAGARPDLVHSVVLLDIVKPVHVTAAQSPHKTEHALDAMIAVEKKLLHGTKPTYTWEEIVERVLKNHFGSLSRTSVHTLLKRGCIQTADGRYSFTGDLQVRCPSIISHTPEQQLGFAARMRCRLLVVKAKDSPDFQDDEGLKEILEQYRSSCSEYEYVIVPGGHHAHLETPEEVAPHIVAFLAANKLAHVHNNYAADGSSLVAAVNRLASPSANM